MTGVIPRRALFLALASIAAAGAVVASLFLLAPTSLAHAAVRGWIPPLTEAQRAHRFQGALTYEQFVAADTAQRAAWPVKHAAAAATIAGFRDRARAIPGRWRLLIIADTACRDAVNSVPYLDRLASVQPSIELRMLRKEDAKDLLRTHRREGRSPTPLVVLYDEHFIERGSWMERPLKLRTLIASEKGSVSDDSLRKDVAAWRAADNGRSVLNEVLTMIERECAGYKPGALCR